MNGASFGAPSAQSNMDRKMAFAEQLVLELGNPDLRENGLLELSMNLDTAHISYVEKVFVVGIIRNAIEVFEANQKGCWSVVVGRSPSTFSEGSLIPELQKPATWEKLNRCLRKGRRIMVNVGGSCVVAENKLRDGKVMMEETLKAMRVVFGEKLFVLSLENRKDDSSLALTGDLPQPDLWKKFRLDHIFIPNSLL
ncbi:uncharacterized protein LOC133288472 [Gastrolobium bilobum]|uniref:uncharacterized protein LOC133288472 n=1 Tax=Gastrolobium bilobum TaxID=150636 RepID=UPI002AAF15DC|nr:uncharacterized protein LOC133288472 [Gastrolobium bilobum]